MIIMQVFLALHCLQGGYMPKKKLTKAQVKRKLGAASNAVYDLFLDKLGHSDSSVPLSKPKLMSILDDINRSKLRIK